MKNLISLKSRQLFPQTTHFTSWNFTCAHSLHWIYNTESLSALFLYSEYSHFPEVNRVLYSCLDFFVFIRFTSNISFCFCIQNLHSIKFLSTLFYIHWSIPFKCSLLLYIYLTILQRFILGLFTVWLTTNYPYSEFLQVILSI